MIPGLAPIPIQELRALSCSKVWSVDGYIDDFDSLTPLKGEVSADHQGEMLNVKGEVKTVVNLSCDRCLGRFNQLLSFKEEEVIWLGKSPPDQLPKNYDCNLNFLESMIECLNPSGEFDPERWIFEQLNLRLQPVNLCGVQCPGPAILHSEKCGTENKQIPKTSVEIDPRWASLKKLLS